MQERLFGFLPLNKPRGISSRTAVDAVKKLVGPSKVGHTGTLDPLADGMLVVCVGPATRLATFVQQSKKTYIGSFTLGVSSASDDSETELHAVEHAPVIARQQLENMLPEFTGAISQVPPTFSAIKVGGKRAYELARKGKPVKLEPREVQVYSLELLDFSYPNFKLKTECGAGTYIRSLGRDIGERLGSAAIMTGLTRTDVGSFSLSDSTETQGLTFASVKQQLVEPGTIFSDLPTAKLDDDQIARLINGASFEAHELQLPGGLQRVVAVNQQNKLLALFQSGKSAEQYRIEYNFANHYAVGQQQV